MQDIDQEKFALLLTGLADYYGKELSTGTIGLYWQGLKQFDIRAVEKALWEHTQNPDSGQFMPKIADVVRMMQGRTADQAAIAWTKVDRAIRRVGTYSDVVFDDPIIHRVISDIGGWIKLGQSDEKEWPFIGNRFIAAYRSYRERGEIPEYQPVLTGIANASNAQHGFKLLPPMLIGNEEKAKRVMLTGTNDQLLSMKLAGDDLAENVMRKITA